MLPEFGASEMLVVAIVALIVVGPKDLPVLLRQLGRMVSKMRALAADFRSSFDEMARQSELDELRKEVEALRTSKLDPLKQDLEAHFDEMQHHVESAQAALDGRPAMDPAPILDPADEYQLPPMPDVAPEPQPISAPEAELAAEPAPKPKKPRAPRKPKADPETEA